MSRQINWAIGAGNESVFPFDVSNTTTGRAINVRTVDALARVGAAIDLRRSRRSTCL